MAAALETLRIIRETDYIEHSVRLGNRLREGLDRVASRHGFGLRQTGPVQMPQILFDNDPDFRVGYAFAEEMVARGIYLHPYHNMFLCAAMTEADMDSVIEAADASFVAVKGRRDSLQPHKTLMELLTDFH
jgi:glutamate-1-semialdehyde 2,1-aminomutase